MLQKLTVREPKLVLLRKIAAGKAKVARSAAEQRRYRTFMRALAEHNSLDGPEPSDTLVYFLGVGTGLGIVSDAMFHKIMMG